MTEEINQPLPKAYIGINEATKRSGFTMASDVLTCSLLRTLAGTKPAGKFLELGTGTGLSTAWILDGMDNDSSLISIDNEPEFLETAREFLGEDKRLNLIYTDGGQWMENNQHQKFDYIFADTNDEITTSSPTIGNTLVARCFFCHVEFFSQSKSNLHQSLCIKSTRG